MGRERSFRNHKVRLLAGRVAGVPDLRETSTEKKMGLVVVLSNLKNSKDEAVTENAVNRQGKTALNIIEVTT